VVVRDEVSDLVEAVVQKKSMPMKTLLKLMKTRSCAKLARLGNASGTKARPGVIKMGYHFFFSTEH
jgi:hypothetical protein